MNPEDGLITLALAEDIGTGDITTDALIAKEQTGRGVIVAKEDLIVCGIETVRRVFHAVDPDIRIDGACRDGDRIAAGATVMSASGRMGSLLKAERTALNFLQRLSGIATHVRTYVDALPGETSTRLVDTRKTTPGWRALEKYAVRIGGAANHRMGLYDGVLIKDNHIAACGGVADAVARARSGVHHLVKVEVEVSDFAQLAQALDAGADVIMLDNMPIADVREAVRRIGGRALSEVSGNVSLKNLSALAATGVDIISVGALTHQARSVDLSMRIAAADQNLTNS
ncbi:MAG: carboxylating nicotinate-nucleotide diphosphorylase [Pseudomonadota bacterium]